MGNQSRIELAKQLEEHKKRMARKAAVSSSRRAILQGAFTIGGAIIGALPSLGAGTAAGAMAGAALGQGASNILAGSKLGRDILGEG
jgi:hypothetical protein